MGKLIIYAVMLLFAGAGGFGCAKPIDGCHLKNVNSPKEVSSKFDGPREFEPYVESFIAEGWIQGVYLSTENPLLKMQYSDLTKYGSEVIGLCETDEDTNSRTVSINKEWFGSVSDIEKMLLIHHELGHCVLYRGHRNDTFEDKSHTPKSIMYPYILEESVYTHDEDYYRNELYTYQESTEKVLQKHVTIIN